MRENVVKRLDALRNAIDAARSVPMSASVMINRTEFHELLSELEIAIEGTLTEATEVVGDRDAFVDTGRLEAIEILRQAERKSQDLVSDTDVYRLALLHAEETKAAAESEAAALRAETDAYVESKLANFEDALERTASSVRSGRAQLAGPNPPAVDEEMRVETDEYVASKLADFEATLVSTIALVQHGRAQLSGGHSHGLGDDSDVDEIELPQHLER